MKYYPINTLESSLHCTVLLGNGYNKCVAGWCYTATMGCRRGGALRSSALQINQESVKSLTEAWGQAILCSLLPFFSQRFPMA